MKKIYLLVCFWCIAAAVLAVPAQRAWRQLQLTDGSVVEAMLLGDEHFSWWETADGRVIEETEAGYAFARNTADGIRQQARRAQRAAIRHIGSQASAPLPSVGSPRIPVILVNFQDSVFHVGQTEAELRTYFDLFCNGTRDGQLYTAHGSYGAIRDYFVNQSRGLFTPEFEIIGVVTLDNNEAYYGGNSSGSKDTKYSDFCREAITKAMAAYDVDWMRFSNRGNNQVDMVFFIFAGCGEANGGAATTLWPKWSSIGMNVNGVTFRSALCGNEARPNANKTYNGVRPDGIGILCHEMNHALGLPDFYDTNYKAFGMDLWSIMDYGQYGNNGYQPAAMTAYEREFMGWETIEELTQPGWFSLEPTATTGKGYKIVNPENTNEYYIVENRQPAGWDSGICRFGHGLQVTHVDYNAGRWSANTVNTDVNHQRMTIIAANNRYIGTCVETATGADLMLTWAGNLFPYAYTDAQGQSQLNDSLTAYSVPAATVFTAAGFMGKDLNSIRENADQTVTFYFGHRMADALSSLPAEDGAIGRPSGSNAESAEALFDLAGRRVQGAPRRGIYVVGGRKVVVP